jgi:hypothetical protein
MEARMHRKFSGGRSALLRQRDYINGNDSVPKWDMVELVVPMFDEDGETCLGGIYLGEETIDHPEQIPILSLYQMDDDGRLLGEVWISSADLPQLISALREQLEMNYSSPARRRWRGMPDGPRLYFGDWGQVEETEGE